MYTVYFINTDHHLPSKRAFQTQFKRWDFPSKQNPAHKNAALVQRVKELWDCNTSQREMLRTLNEEGFDIKERELMRVRAKNRWLLRVPNGMKSKKRDTDQDVINQLQQALYPDGQLVDAEGEEEPMEEMQMAMPTAESSRPARAESPPLSPEVMQKRRERLVSFIKLPVKHEDQYPIFRFSLTPITLLLILRSSRPSLKLNLRSGGLLESDVVGPVAGPVCQLILQDHPVFPLKQQSMKVNNSWRSTIGFTATSELDSNVFVRKQISSRRQSLGQNVGRLPRIDSFRRALTYKAYSGRTKITKSKRSWHSMLFAVTLRRGCEHWSVV
jgi:hypothetical protein